MRTSKCHTLSPLSYVERLMAEYGSSVGSTGDPYMGYVHISTHIYTYKPLWVMQGAEGDAVAREERQRVLSVR